MLFLRQVGQVGLVFVAVLILARAPAGAQDPIATLPDAYKLLLENEWVKVTRVHYAPKVKLPEHAHTAWASAYVYLNDSGPVVFRHVGADYGAVTRRPTTARSIRLFRGIKEVHEVENLSALPSDFLRVEFKTDPVDPRSLRGTLPPEPAGSGIVNKEQFANDQVRVTRIVIPPGASLELVSDPDPSLLVSLSPAELGTVRWLPRGRTERLDNASPEPREVVRFELKTAPR